MASEAPKQLRRKRFGGVDPEDVARALADLAKRNMEIGRELAGARQREAELQQDLDGFKSALRQVSALLTLAEDRASQIEQEAEAKAEMVRREIDGLADTKRDTIAELTQLRSRLDDAISAANARQLRALSGPA